MRIPRVSSAMLCLEMPLRKPRRDAASRLVSRSDCSTVPRQFAPLLRSFYRDEQGSYLIEAALVLVLYLTLTFAMMSVALILFAYANTVYASKVAVRYAVVHSSASAAPCSKTDIQKLVQPYLWGAPASGITIAPTWSPSNTVGSTFSITVALSFPTSLPFVDSAGLKTTTTAQGYILH